jgi:hypothetical protein
MRDINRWRWGGGWDMIKLINLHFFYYYSYIFLTFQSDIKFKYLFTYENDLHKSRVFSMAVGF